MRVNKAGNLLLQLVTDFIPSYIFVIGQLNGAWGRENVFRKFIYDLYR